jgi:hypothetical protein
MGRVRLFVPIAQKERPTNSCIRIVIPHPHLHDVYAKVFAIELVKIVTELKGDILMYLIFEPGKQFVPRVGIIGPVRVLDPRVRTVAVADLA